MSMHSLLCLLALAMPAVQNRPNQGSGEAQEPGIPPIVDEGDVYLVRFDEKEGVDLESLTKLCQKATGINFTYDQPTAASLQGKKVKIFGTKRIPKSEFYSFYQIIMFINQFVCTKVGPDPLSVVVIQDLAGQGQRGPANANLQSEAIYVLPDELDRYSSQVATPIMTVLHLPHTDVRQLGNSLRALTADQGQSQGVIPVGSTNSVIIRGFASNVASLARILLLVDRESAKETGVLPVFEVIPLEYAAAQDISDVVEQLLEASRRVQERGRTQLQAAQGATAPIQAGGGESKIMVDARTNSLLIMALPDDMQAIKELIARLDVEVVEPERNYHVYSLENVTAADLAEVLEDFIQDASRLESQSGQARPAGAQGGAPTPSSSDSEIVVVPDPATNALLIAASKSRYEEVLDLIRRLDRRQDQVLIETALIELSGGSTLDIGVELGFAKDPGSSGKEGFGVTSFGLSTIDLSDPANPVRVPAAAQGITAGIISADDFQLPVLIAAAQGRDDTNVLNIPSVLVNNNGSATVSSITEEPTTELQPQNVGGPIQSFAGYEDAGITMSISPSISASGYLRLNVYLEVSTFGVSSNVNLPPPRLTRVIDTAVSVPDGDTMVIGGIITDNSTKSRAGVPWLSDLPVVGVLFRRDKRDADQQTLYFFVTPHILRDKDFADLSEISYKKKLEAAERIGADRLKMVDPAFGAENDKVDMGGFEVPLYKSPQRGEIEPNDVGLDPERRAELLNGAKPASTPPTSNQPPGNQSPGN